MKIKRSDKCLAFGCFNPQRIKNPYTGEIFYTSCNHCVACLNAKATKYSLRVENEVKQNKYSIYFTLTYSNYAIPRIIESVKKHVFENGCEVPLTLLTVFVSVLLSAVLLILEKLSDSLLFRMINYNLSLTTYLRQVLSAVQIFKSF